MTEAEWIVDELKKEILNQVISINTPGYPDDLDSIMMNYGAGSIYDYYEDNNLLDDSYPCWYFYDKELEKPFTIIVEKYQITHNDCKITNIYEA